MAGLGALLRQMPRPADSWAPARDVPGDIPLAGGLARPRGESSLGFVHQPAPKARFAQLCDPPKKCPNQLERKSLPSDRLYPPTCDPHEERDPHPTHRTREL